MIRVLHVSDCEFSPWEPCYHEMRLAHDDDSAMFGREDGEPARLQPLGRLLELQSTSRDLTDWQSIEALSFRMKWEVAFFELRATVEFVAEFQPCRVKAHASDSRRLHLLWDPSAKARRRRGHVHEWSSLAEQPTDDEGEDGGPNEDEDEEGGDETQEGEGAVDEEIEEGEDDEKHEGKSCSDEETSSSSSSSSSTSSLCTPPWRR